MPEVLQQQLQATIKPTAKAEVPLVPWSKFIVSKNGSYNNTREFEQAVEDMGVHHTTRLSHYHQSNGLAEKYMQIIKCLLAKANETYENPHFAMIMYRNTLLGSGL